MKLLFPTLLALSGTVFLDGVKGIDHPVRHYWEWVCACMDWAVSSQDRYFCTLDGKIECRAGWQFELCEGPMCAYLVPTDEFCKEPKFLAIR